MATISRSEQQSRYVMVYGGVIEDCRLSWAAVGLWAAIEARGDTFIDVERLTYQRGDVTDLINELIAAGYLTIEEEE